MAQRRCVLLHLRTRLGDEFFLHVAAFVPMSCQLGLADAEEGGVAKLLRQSVREHSLHHWLMRYIDRPLACVQVSVHALSEAIVPCFGFQPRLDRDGVYALLALRFFAPMPEMLVNMAESNEEDIDSMNANFTSDKLPSTPLCSAVQADDAELVRLLLQHRAEPNGYQSRWFNVQDGDDPETKVTPLFMAVTSCQHNCVLRLLQGRADPDVWGYDRQWCGERYRGLWHQMRFEHKTPLWRAAKHACSFSPTSQQGIVSRAILKSLLLFGASPSRLGTLVCICPCEGFPMNLDRDVDSGGDVHFHRRIRSSMTPLEAAIGSSTGDVVQILQSHGR